MVASSPNTKAYRSILTAPVDRHVRTLAQVLLPGWTESAHARRPMASPSPRPDRSPAPVEHRGAAVLEAADGVEPAILEYPDQIDRGYAAAVRPHGRPAEFCRTRRRILAPEYHGHTGVAARPLAGDLAPNDLGLCTKTPRPIAGSRAVADRPRVNPVGGGWRGRGAVGKRARRFRHGWQSRHVGGRFRRDLYGLSLPLRSRTGLLELRSMVAGDGPVAGGHNEHQDGRNDPLCPIGHAGGRLGHLGAPGFLSHGRMLPSDCGARIAPLPE